MKKRHKAESVLLTAMTLFASIEGFAANTFTAVSGSDWNTAANWSEGVPVAGQDVVVNGNATLTNATPALASLNVNSGKTLTFDGWDTLLSATTVTIVGTVTHAQNTDTNAVDGWTPSARVNIACGGLTLSTGGKIDVNGKGYLGAPRGALHGCGPGAGGFVAANNSGGGGHGGTGAGRYAAPGAYGQPYGSAAAPEQPGSGGAGGDYKPANNPPVNVLGCPGGGAVKIAATGHVLVNGQILASGSGGVSTAGSGAGGSIYIACQTFAATNGTLNASGGNGAAWGGDSGGGGRIAVIYETTAQSNMPPPKASLLAACGKFGSSGVDADLGTLYFPDSQLFTRAEGDIAFSGRWLAPTGGKLVRSSTSLKNCWLRLPEDGSIFEAGSALAVTGTDATIHKFEMTNGVLRIGGDLVVNKASLVMRAADVGGPVLDCPGDLVLTNGAALYVESAATASPTNPGARVEVAGDMVVASTGSWVYPTSHPTNGASVLFTMNRLLLPTAGAGFNASGRGFRGGEMLSVLPVERRHGLGPGGGGFINDGLRGGGGHGGIGGGATGDFGKSYGSANLPAWAGSGGAGGDSAGGYGGGVVRIEAVRDIVLGGSILANGNAALNSGGGAGGSIWIVCREFSGTATAVLSANGGNGANWGGGRGGGGRIAVWHDLWEGSYARLLNEETWSGVRLATEYDKYLGAATVAQGTGGSVTQDAGPGTLVFLSVPPPPATVIVVR